MRAHRLGCSLDFFFDIACGRHEGLPTTTFVFVVLSYRRYWPIDSTRRRSRYAITSLFAKRTLPPILMNGRRRLSCRRRTLVAEMLNIFATSAMVRSSNVGLESADIFSMSSAGVGTACADGHDHSTIPSTFGEFDELGRVFPFLHLPIVDDLLAREEACSRAVSARGTSSERHTQRDMVSG